MELDFEITAMHCAGPTGPWNAEASGASILGGFEYPWIPPHHGWEQGPILITTVFSTSVSEDFDSEDFRTFLAVAGFGSQTVDSLRVEHDGTERSITLSAPLRAFVAVSVGVSGIVLLTPFNEAKEQVGPRLQLPRPRR